MNAYDAHRFEKLKGKLASAMARVAEREAAILKAQCNAYDSEGCEVDFCGICKASVDGCTCIRARLEAEKARG